MHKELDLTKYEGEPTRATVTDTYHYLEKGRLSSVLNNIRLNVIET